MNDAEWRELERAAKSDAAAAGVWADAYEQAEMFAAAALVRLHALAMHWGGRGGCDRVWAHGSRPEVGLHLAWRVVPAHGRPYGFATLRWCGRVFRVLNPRPRTAARLTGWLTPSAAGGVRLVAHRGRQQWRLFNGHLMTRGDVGAAALYWTPWLTEAYELLVTMLAGTVAPPARAPGGQLADPGD